MNDRKLAVAGALFLTFVVGALLGWVEDLLQVLDAVPFMPLDDPTFEARLGVVLQGAALGVGTGLMAVGLVLIYRTTRVINFAYGAMGTVAGALASGLTLGTLGLSWYLSVPIAVATGIALGLLVEVVVIRRFARSPRLVLTVATIGLAQALGGLALFLPDWLGTEPLNPGFETPLSDIRWRVDPVTLNGNHLLLAAVAPLALAGLAWFLFRTTSGTAVRGMAENLDRARLLGIPVNQINLVLWGVAGGLAAITVVLKAPTQGLAVDAAAGPTVLLAPLAAAVVVGMRSLAGAFLAGVAIEVLDQLMQINLSSRTWTYVVLLGVIVVGLLLQDRATSRADAAGEGTWSTVGVSHRLSRPLAALPEVRALRVLAALVALAVLVWIPLAGSPSQVNQATITAIYALAAVSLVVLTGWGGVVSLGQFALVGVGGVVAANLIVDRNLDLFATIALAALAGGVVAALIGIPALRVSGQLLAVTTLAFAVAMQVHVINPSNYTELVPGDFERPELFGSVALADERWLYLLALVLLAGAVAVVANLHRTRTGRVVRAIRDNERAAAATGISTTRTKITAFVISGMFAGMAGALHAVALRGIGVNTYEAADSLLLFSMAIIGGVTSLGGTVAGVAVVQWLGYTFPRLQLLLTGVGLLVILMILPGGLAEAFERARDRVARAAARRRGLDLDQPLPAEAAGHGDAPSPRAPVRAGDEQDDGAPAAGSDALLSCAGLESGYGSLQVLFGVDLEVGDGDVLALLGTNGAGKSTLFKALVGLLPAGAGRVHLAGHDITGLTPEAVARRGLSMMPGGKGVFPTLTVAENMRLATWMLHGDAERTRARTEAMLAMFPILRERWDLPAGNLSGGEQQQLSIAMAFVTEPRVVLIDELSLGLAPAVVGMLVDKIRELHDQGTTIVLVEQSINVALLMGEEALFLEKGQVRFRGPTAGLLDRPDILRAVFIGDGTPAGTTTGDEADAPAFDPTGPTGDGTDPRDRGTRALALEGREISKRFGGITAVDAVDLTVAPGRIVGLIGHNGAGKTTLFDVLTGFLDLDGGRVVLDGIDISEHPPHRRAILGLGRSFQEARLYPSLTVRECIQVALERHLANRDPVAAALRLPASVDSERAAEARAEELMALLGLADLRDRPTGELSTGTRRIVELACLLAQDPAVVLLDEPTAGVAQAETEALVPLLRRIRAETGCSMVVVEHDMGLLSALCDEFVALDQGRVIARGTPAEVLADPDVVASYLGTDDTVVHRSGPRPAPAAT